MACTLVKRVHVWGTARDMARFYNAIADAPNVQLKHAQDTAWLNRWQRVAKAERARVRVKASTYAARKAARPPLRDGDQIQAPRSAAMPLAFALNML